MTPQERLAPYPMLKDSGATWLGTIPAHWEVRRLKTLATVELSNVDKTSVEGEIPVRLCNYVDVYKNERITGAMDFMAATATPEQVRRFSLRVGDVLITKDSESWSDIAVPSVVTRDLPDVLCGYHLALVRPRGDRLHGPSLARAFSGSGIRDHYYVSANGITRFGLGGDAIRTACFPTPPVEEQERIASFLDRETAKIDELVAKKERLSELLQEKRAALITRAVTKGLNQGIALKDSGSSSLGRIPTHWDSGALSRWWKVIDCKHRTVPFVDEGIPVASIGEVQSLEVDLRNANRTPPHEYRVMVEGDRNPRPGDVIYSRNATVGSAALVTTADSFCLGQDVSLLRAANQDGRFLVFLLRSPAVMRQLEALMIGSTFNRINVGAIKRLHLCIPPLREQHQIAAICLREHRRTARIVSKVRDAIARLKELRTALISAAVTGKIDVRSA